MKGRMEEGMEERIRLTNKRFRESSNEGEDDVPTKLSKFSKFKKNVGIIPEKYKMMHLDRPLVKLLISHEKVDDIVVEDKTYNKKLDLTWQDIEVLVIKSDENLEPYNVNGESRLVDGYDRSRECPFDVKKVSGASEFPNSGSISVSVSTSQRQYEFLKDYNGYYLICIPVAVSINSRDGKTTLNYHERSKRNQKWYWVLKVVKVLPEKDDE